MTTQTFMKGLLMAIMAVIVSAFSTTPVDYVMLAISAPCAILVYVGKNLIAVWHSDSPPAVLSLINILSGMFVALGTGLLDGVAMYLINGAVVWAVLWKYVIYISGTYLLTTIFSPPHNDPSNKKLFVK
jgi:hypothetical protein